MSKILEIRNLTKEYVMGEVTVHALCGVALDVYEGEFIVILGPSGSGKSTLLNIIGGIDSPTEGDVVYYGQNISEASERELTLYRRAAVGFVFQFYNLIPNLTARENIALASEMSVDPISVEALLEDIGLADRGHHFPSQLSGGQQQRVAIARALVTSPRIVIADEPTANLDSETGEKVLDLMKEINRQEKTTFIFSTHDPEIWQTANHIVFLHDGNIRLEERR